MSAFDSKGERVEELAKWSHEDLVQARWGAGNELYRAKRALEDRQQMLDNARKWYEEQVEKIEHEALEAPEKIARLKKWVEELDERLARLKVESKPKASVWDKAARDAEIDRLTKRLLAGDVGAAEELKKVMMK